MNFSFFLFAHIVFIPSVSHQFFILYLLNIHSTLLYIYLNLSRKCSPKPSKECSVLLHMSGWTSTPKSSAKEWLEIKAPSKLNRLLTMAHKWLVESRPKKQEPLISVYLFSKTACKPKRILDAMLQWFTFLLQEQLMPSSKLWKLNSI